MLRFVEPATFKAQDGSGVQISCLFRWRCRMGWVLRVEVGAVWCFVGERFLVEGDVRWRLDAAKIWGACGNCLTWWSAKFMHIMIGNLP